MEENIKSICILYIATGPYIAFWKDFYCSFEKYFLNECEVHYMIFTDSENIPYSENERVNIVYQKPEPWPLPTLLKYHRFLEYEKFLSQFDYLYQSNANIICYQTVTAEEFLPNEKEGENLMFTVHPGFYNKMQCFSPYDRNKKSGAYVSYGDEEKYVFGAMNGGKTQSFIEFMKQVDYGIIEDLKKNKIALWHDESWVNKMILKRTDVKLLNPGYCYPVGFDVPFEKKIIGVSKKVVFDVDAFKGNEPNDKTNYMSLINVMANWLFKIWVMIQYKYACLIKKYIKSKRIMDAARNNINGIDGGYI